MRLKTHIIYFALVEPGRREKKLVETTDAVRTAEKRGANTESRTELEARVDAGQKTSMGIMDFNTPGLTVGAERKRQRITEQESRKDRVESEDSVAQAESEQSEGHTEQEQTQWREELQPPELDHEEIPGETDMVRIHELPNGDRFEGTRTEKVVDGIRIIEYDEVPPNGHVYDARIVFNYNLLKPVLEFALKFVKELILSFDTTGLHSRFVDPSHVMMGSFHIPREEFVEYDGIVEKVTVAINVEKITSLKIKGDENVWLRFQVVPKMKATTENKDSNTRVTYRRCEKAVLKDKMELQYGNTTNTIAALDEELITVPKIPPLEQDGYVIIPASNLGDFLSRAENVSDAFRMTLTREKLTLVSAADEERVETTVTDGEWKDIRVGNGIKNKGSIKSLYPVEYMRNAMKALRTAEWVKMSFRDDYPMEAEFRLKNRPETKITFLLAPRMEQ